MELIIGGAFQGKGEYAKYAFPEVTWRKGNEVEEEELLKSEGILSFHKYIEKEMRAGRDVRTLAKHLIEQNPDIILVSDEVGYGVVPVDAFERAYREAVGRVCTELASFSTRVIRVICGVGTVIKDA